MVKKYSKLELNKVTTSSLYTTSQIFLFNRKMKLIELKQQVCQFWGLDPSEFELFENSNLLLMRYEETVEMYFYSTIDAQRATPELFLQVPDRLRHVETGSKEKKQANLGEDEEENERRRKKAERNKKAAEIEQKYPGFSKCARDGKKQREIPLNIDNNIYSFLIVLFLLILSIITYTMRRDVTTQYSIDKFVQEYFSSSFNEARKLEPEGEGSLGEFLKGFFEFINDYENGEKLLVIKGDNMIRLLNVKEKSCRQDISSRKTCYERYYNDRTKSIC